jgi:GTP pyrophosphokinase
VAAVLSEATNDSSLLGVAILNDILIHPQGETLLRKSPLTKDEQGLVRHMYGLRRLHIDESTHDLDHVINEFTEDPRLLLLRMAHRLNDVRHLNRFSGMLRKSIANETLHMYAAIAGRLGMDTWRYEMEDTCFHIVQPTIAKRLKNLYQSKKTLDEACLKHAKNFLSHQLKEHAIECRMDQRVKTLYSTYRKMVTKNRRFEDLTDRLALRIIVHDTMECYRALAIIHSCMHPIPGKLKDYIGAPKENGYRSIHTVVYPLTGVTEQPMEIQIRTEEMHRTCEFGVSAHGEYKNTLYALNSHPARVDLFRNLQNLQEDTRSPEEFEQALRKYFSENHVAVFGASNTLYHFKQPLTALDFVCQVFPNRYRMLRSVCINGRTRPLSTRLHDGDTIEAIFGRTILAETSWQHACCYRTSKKMVREGVKG